MHKLFYLIYKLKNDDQLWIISVSESYNELKDRIIDIDNKDEDYFIVRRKFINVDEKFIDKELERKHFRTFISQINDALFYQT